MSQTALTARSKRSVEKASRVRLAIQSIICQNEDQAGLRWFVYECQRLALVHLRRKVRTGSLQLRQFGLPIEDLALDCIADLFGYRSGRRCEPLRTYFESIGWQELGEQELTNALQRLVFSKVNDGLFRHYREAEPALSKIIRNIKNAVRKDPHLSIRTLNRESWLLIGDPDLSLPRIPSEPVVDFLTPALRNSASMAHAVALFKEFMLEEKHYFRGYPLLALANSIYVALSHLAEPAEEERESFFLPDEVSRAISYTVRQVQEEMHPSYVRRQKLDTRTFGAYFRAAEDFLLAQYADEHRADLSHFEALRGQLPHLNRSQYRAEHRHKFEYVIRLSKSRLICGLASMV